MGEMTESRDQVLRWLDPRQAPEFVMGPAGEIDRF